MPKRISGLDGIRAVSITLVLFHHIADGIIPWAKYGTFGVQIFFVLSGFLITWLLCIEEDKHGVISLPSFYARRALRILPPAFLCIAVVSLLALAGLADVQRYEPLYCAFFVRNMLFPNGGIHLGHFWTLAIEEQFYLLWPLGFLLLHSNRKRLIFCIALFFGAPFWTHLMYRLQGGIANVNPLRFDVQYGALMAGCCLAVLRHDPELRWLASNRVLRSTPAALLAIAAIVAGLRNLPTMAFSGTLSFIGVAVFINFAVERERGAIGSFLNWGPVVWIGQLSYSLYLWQQIFCYHSKLPWLGQFPQNAIASLAAAALSFYLLESPLAKVRRRIRHLPNPQLFFGTGRMPAESLAAEETITS